MVLSGQGGLSEGNGAAGKIPEVSWQLQEVA